MDKLLWILVTHPAQVMKDKCFPLESPLAATVKPSASFDWRSITAAKSIVKEGSLRNGN